MNSFIQIFFIIKVYAILLRSFCIFFYYMPSGGRGWFLSFYHYNIFFTFTIGSVSFWIWCYMSDLAETLNFIPKFTKNGWRANITITLKRDVLFLNFNLHCICVSCKEFNWSIFSKFTIQQPGRDIIYTCVSLFPYTVS